MGFPRDFDLDRPLDEELDGLIRGSSSVHFIHGNHDADREEWHDFVFESAIANRNLNARVVSAGGVRIAGVGGVFHEAVWHPHTGDGLPKFFSRDEFLASRPPRMWRGGLPLRHRSTFFAEDFNALAAQEADILITHEAPSSRRLGFCEIDDLAEIMGVKLIVHGHHHETYRSELPNGIRVIGVGKAEVLVSTFADLFARDAPSV
ncbi:metallophosphoesterase (plasmid) [Rhizobium sp. CB3090]|uniref:metallophosphoesterase family protein n=1 Tax=Rhizobium sp. CB3090 TaxID=3039156 RepID=UPI0024B11EFE|nr:metallophosphoesterase [Rhizobium sp. CB3090]WFU11548.1 metallophosphoesterase [Rhizobium sp. CB3090]